jgi:hypothetical protein
MAGFHGFAKTEGPLGAELVPNLNQDRGQMICARIMVVVQIGSTLDLARQGRYAHPFWVFTKRILSGCSADPFTFGFGGNAFSPKWMAEDRSPLVSLFLE